MRIGKKTDKNLPLQHGGGRGEVEEKGQKSKRKVRYSDVIFFVLIALLLIPQTRSVFLAGVSQIRTAILTPALKVQDGPVLSEDNDDWVLIDLAGKQVTLADYRGEVLLVNSWATWCPPCRAEMPALERLYQSYGQRIKMILVTQEEPAVVQEFIDQKEFTFPVYISQTAYPPAFSSRSIPATYIVNRSGQVVYQRNGAFDWNSGKVRKFLDRLLAD